jgi:hypothetical protein
VKKMKKNFEEKTSKKNLPHRRRYHAQHPDQLPGPRCRGHGHERGQSGGPGGEGSGGRREAEDFGVAFELAEGFFSFFLFFGKR